MNMEEKQGGWGQLLLSLVGQFLLLRDFFGYMLPGFMLMLLVGYAAIFSYKVSIPANVPRSVVVLITAVMSYVSGHFLAAIGFAVQDLVARSIQRLGAKRKHHPHRKTRVALKFEPQVLYYRNLYPQLFIELDRRDTLALLRTGMGASFALACWLWPFPYKRMGLLVIGVTFLISGYSGREHVAAYRIATIRAALGLDRRNR
jgi:hypothetical protein